MDTDELTVANLIGRTLSAERTYSLGQYQNIKLFDSIMSLPEEVVFDQRLVSEIRYLQFIQFSVTTNVIQRYP